MVCGKNNLMSGCTVLLKLRLFGFGINKSFCDLLGFLYLSGCLTCYSCLTSAFSVIGKYYAMKIDGGAVMTWTNDHLSLVSLYTQTLIQTNKLLSLKEGHLIRERLFYI